MNDKGLNLMAEYVFVSKYAQKKDNGDLETWDDVNNRIYQTHRLKLESLGLLNNDVENYLSKAEYLENKKILLSSQRGRQFAFPDWDSGILKSESKIYNCCGSYVDRVEFFSEAMYLLLCGCGIGYSMHKEYINKLPIVKHKTNIVTNYAIDDSIEGWADSIKELMFALFDGRDVEFDYSKIRPKDYLINGRFKAPGSRPLRKAHENIRKVFSTVADRKLKSIEIHDIICYIAESVVSGGVRRSAAICLFDKDDNDMLTAKSGTWWQDNPQRAMANNSICTAYDDKFSYSDLKSKLSVIRQFGEPGFINVPNYKYVVNPCGEILLKPTINNKTGWAFCNLCEINAEMIKSAEDFILACDVAAFIGTLQSLYTNFKYLSKTSQDIAERDRNIGVSITGSICNKLLDKDLLMRGAKVVVNSNKEWAEVFNINASRTTTCQKPSGNASAILALTHSGCHPAHSKQYLRRIRIKTSSPEYKALKDSPMIRVIDWDNAVISFPITVNNPNAVFKDDLSAVEHLDYVKMLKHFWVNKGSAEKTVNHNVSCTIEVKDDEWNEVAAILHTNTHLLTGVSLLPKAGDEIYELAPFTRLYNDEIKKEFIDIENYIYKNDINFIDIMSEKSVNDASDYVAVGCAGGVCSLA